MDGGRKDADGPRVRELDGPSVRNLHEAIESQITGKGFYTLTIEDDTLMDPSIEVLRKYADEFCNRNQLPTRAIKVFDFRVNTMEEIAKAIEEKYIRKTRYVEEDPGEILLFVDPYGGPDVTFLSINVAMKQGRSILLLSEKLEHLDRRLKKTVGENVDNSFIIEGKK